MLFVLEAKRRGLVIDIGNLLQAATAHEAVDRAGVERLVGRLSHIAQASGPGRKRLLAAALSNPVRNVLRHGSPSG